MTKDERELLNQFNAENRAILYRCRWSPADAEIVVPELIRLLGSDDPHVVDEALRALFCIGTPALTAASAVAAHLR
ncbi:MAG: armadillo/beta-catenin-like repeat-containing protein, partial [Planctomycetaceae bacterium]|nr:armadillo/beta-catenin-like repeat-containing protein [Planctomycetaceae bacterium]